MNGAALTDQQQKVSDLLCKGWSTKEIADSLGLSPRTIETHRENIFRKMGVRNAVELVRKTFGAGQ